MKHLLILVAALALVGCDAGEQTQLQAELANLTKDVRGRVQPLPVVKPYEPLAYQAGALADPFGPAKIALATKGKGGGGPDLSRAKEPLEAYPLESLNMVGTLQQDKRTFALVKADASLYKVQVGNYVGQNYGLVTKIGDGEIELRELVQDAAGDWAERDSALMLQEADATAGGRK
jgi:type IV pilus assembly protein PilP